MYNDGGSNEAVAVADCELQGGPTRTGHTHMKLDIAAIQQAEALSALIRQIATTQQVPTLDEGAVERVTRRVIDGLVDDQRKALQSAVPHARPAQFAPSAHYTSTKTCTELDRAIGAARRSGKRLVLVSGPSGSSKTFAARHAAARLGLPQYTVECSGATTAEDLIARPWTNGEGKLVWVEQCIVQAARNGGVVILDEFDLMDPRVLGRLHSVLDCDPRVRLPSGEELQAHPDFLVIACCNGLRRDTGGTYTVSAISSALLGRAVFVASDYLSESEEVKLYTAQGYAQAEAVRVYRSLHGLRQMFRSGALAIPPSPRLGMAVLGAMAEGASVDEAWTIALFGGLDQKATDACKRVLAAASVASS